MDTSTNKITVRSLILGALFAGLFAWISVYAENRKSMQLTATQIAVTPYVLLFASVLLINPICKLLRFIRIFSVAEILVVFIMGAVSAGVATYGMASQLIPMIHGLQNQHWNTKQSKWNLYVEPFINDAYTLAEPGTQQAAARYREAFFRLKKESTLLSRARGVTGTRKAVVEAEADLERARSEPAGTPRRAGRVNRATKALTFARKAQSQAEALWEPHAAEHDPEEIIKTYPDRVEATRAEKSAREKELADLKKDVYARVKTFRRGLPKEMRAIPGFIKTPDEDLASWLDRISRLRHGMGALSALQDARERLGDEEEDDQELGSDARQAIAEHLRDAAEALAPIGDPSELQALADERTQAYNAVSQSLLEAENRIKDLQKERRSASAEAFDRIDDEIEELTATSADLKIEQKESKRSSELANARLQMSKRVQSALASIREWEAKATGNEPIQTSAMRAMLAATTAKLVTCDGTLKRFLIGDVEWSLWFRPLIRWGWVIALTYIILMALNVLIFRQWAHHEKLIYPLAELPKLLAGHEDNPLAAKTDSSTIPSMYRTGLFWAGFAVPAVIMGWNQLCYTKLVPGLSPISLEAPWKPYVVGSFLDGLSHAGRFDIFFVLIGLAFLIPANISFSLWFFYVFYMLQLLLLIWLGYGVNEWSFPANWFSVMNFRYAEGGGALLVFSAVVLYKCRGYLLCFFWPKSVKDLEKDERTELRISSFLFIFCSAALILTLWLDMGAGLVFTTLVYLIAIMTTIGLVRSVAEGGVLGFQCWFGPFHLMRSFFAGAKGWASTTLGGPLLAYYSVLFMDLKTFIAPAMANSIKIRDDLRLSRLRFHVSILLAISVAAGIAVAAHLILGYDRGGDAMNRWFYDGFPKSTYDSIKRLSTMNSDSIGHSVGWLICGALMMAGLLYGRRFVFWLPHPIGMVMLVSPLMRGYYSSILLGWLIKSLVTKYGSKETYVSARHFFIGMILGEILVVAVSMLLAYVLNIGVGVDLNRHR